MGTKKYFTTNGNAANAIIAMPSTVEHAESKSGCSERAYAKSRRSA
eukprot:CAMPEP_0185551810 /NCGR_PEP_ID=MMETSP1381-20130426/29617_1 /TAXON_ID=298111 /ORGANISM="Pavlova sp., Strain CCMP459" /LENGTH=45 /DNA_ID= /DNA_START= /DNA_END= /DNA_ORIENTATION=